MGRVKRQLVALAVVVGGFAIGWAAAQAGLLTRSCDDACTRLIELGCYAGDPNDQHSSCVAACLGAWCSASPLPVACVTEADSCEEAAQCSGRD